MPTRPVLKTGDIGTAAVTTAKLYTDAVTGAKIADDAVDSEHIAAGAIDLEHMSANSIDSDQYVDGSIDAAHFAAGAVDATALGSNAVTTAKITAANVTSAKLEAALEHYAEVALTNEQVLALHTTAIQLVATPGANLALVPTGIHVWHDYSTAAFADIAAGDDLVVCYTDITQVGSALITVETTGFLDQAADGHRFAMPDFSTAMTPTANTPLVLGLPGAITTGGGVLKVRIYYKILNFAMTFA